MNIVLTMAVLTAAAALSQGETRTVLFVCEHGAAKSVVAAAHFNQLATERGLPLRAISRGTAPDPAVPSGVIDGLRKEGLEVPASFSPSAVAATDVSSAVRVVTFDVSLPVEADPSRVNRWDNLPAFSADYGKASAAIRRKVESLLDELTPATKSPKRHRSQDAGGPAPLSLTEPFVQDRHNDHVERRRTQ